MHRFKLVIIICLIASSGPSADGLAGEYVATQRWRDMLSRHSSLVNPAFLTEENYVSFRACEALVLDNTFNLMETGITVPVGLYRSLGFTYAGEGTALRMDKMKWRSDNSGAVDSLGQGSNRNNLFMLSYADNVWGRLSIGANLSMSHQTLFGSPRFGLAGDFGLSYRLFLDPVMGEHLLGLTLQNILQPLTDLLPASAGFTSQGYSNTVKVSWYTYLWERQFDAGIDVDVKNLYGSLVTLKGEEHSGAAEYGVSLRLGGWLVRMFNAYVQVGTDYWAGAVGINFPQVNFGRDFSVLYQYMNVMNVENVPVQSFYFRMDLGLHREESYARMMARRWNVAPNELYNKALRLYMAQQYWDAFFVFSQLYAQYPSFVKTDMVTYYRGACLEKLDMRDEAEQYYKETIRQYGASEIAPHAELGLMRLYYRGGNAASLADRFTRMAPSSAPDSLKYHAFYLMAESRMKDRDFAEATRLFAKIPQYHAEYVFAQHSAAIAALMADRRAEAIEHLANCINAKTQTAAQKECVNRSYLYLGYLFYGSLELPKAITALRTILATSYYYEDGLLGMCWTALKAKQWDACLEYGQTLRKISSHPPLRCDAMLIMGYAYLMQKKYSDASVVLKEADDQLGSLIGPRPDSLARVRGLDKTVRAGYNDIARTVDKFSVMAQTSENIGAIDSLHRAQQQAKAALDGYAAFSDEYARATLFARNADAIKNDIAFTFAIVQRFNRDSRALEEQEKMQGKKNNIDEKIEQMKKELEKLNSGNK
jgi:tetratricopeptide (TPR) repeat protein